jgi:DNA (cytosine-5)-methyltransferase 1
VLEQVPAVLPIWQKIATLLPRDYRAAVGVLSAEQYGVPQTRRRAVLVASRVRDVELPRPTHSRYYATEPGRLDEGVLPWVSMAQALSWGMTERPYLTVAPGTASGGTDPQALGGSGARRTVRREKDAGRWLPKFNDQSGSPFDHDWPFKRPATTIAGRGIVGNPGVNANRFNGSAKSRNDGVRVSVAEAGVLQAFPPDYPWSGNEGAQYQQVGDAVPPLLAEAILRAAADELICVECGNDTTVQGEAMCMECLEGTATS